MKSLHQQSLSSTAIAKATAEESERSKADPSATLLSSRRVRTQPWIKSTKTLSLLSAALHLILVVIHLALVAVWHMRVEHGFVFSLEHQTTISFSITAVTTALGTIYYAGLVFLIQKLSMRKSLHESQTLTTTHDNAAAWAGIGSALSRVWYQKAVPASLSGVFSAFFYLGNILALHITTPALFSLQTFNSSRSISVTTQGFPVLDLTAYNMSDALSRTIAWEDIQSYAISSLYFLPYTARTNTSVGLHGGSLYDVPNVNVGNVTVGAIGFNVTCGYLIPTTITAGVESIPFTPEWNMNFYGEQQYYPIPMLDGAGSGSGTYPLNGNFTTSGLDMILYWGSEKGSRVLDSSGNDGARLLLNPEPYYAQLLRCSLSTINQTAVIDAQSQEVLELEPPLLKTHSVWSPASPSLLGPQDYLDPLAKPGISLVDLWQAFYIACPAPATYGGPITDPVLNQNLNNAGGRFAASNITLHDLENSLSIVVASMFWTLTYIPPLNEDPTLVPSPVRLQAGQAVTIQPSTEARLDLNIIAIAAGLGASVGLALLSLQFSRFRTNRTQVDAPIDGTGFLQAIWLYRNHPELEILVDQVEHPTEDNLRVAGMVTVALLDEFSPARKRKWEY
ncbi:hypothetical protein C8R45DRAFT_973929 [Mycena sanguinolenta]|nr:hypothetical protein C8R45DRAFT_973929 [Mycena sanguinolenta]